ncbi:MAG: sulfatase [bacterium]|nr:sulfatase [bacterium]
MVARLTRIFLACLLCACSDGPRAIQGVVHLDPRLADGTSSARTLDARRVVVGEWQASGPDTIEAEFAPWRFFNTVFLESQSGAGAHVRARDYDPQRGLKFAGFALEDERDTQSFNTVELVAVLREPGAAAVRFTTADGRRKRVVVNFDPSEQPQRLRIGLDRSGAWTGTVKRLEVLPMFRGIQSFEVHAVRLVDDGFTLARARALHGDAEGDAGILGIEGDGRRAWPSDLDVPLFARARVPRGARLVASCALAPGARVEGRVRFSVDVRSGDWTSVGEVEVGAEDGWKQLACDLTPFAGQEVELRLRATQAGDGQTGDGLGGDLRRARVWWGAPMVTGEQVADRRPDVVLVTLDTLRTDAIGAYGGAANTPVLDALAREGILYMDAWSTTNSTLPSHTSILTGLDLPSHGVLDNRSSLAPGIPTVAEALRAAGYHTAAAVSVMHLGAEYSGLGRGFDYFRDARSGAEIDGDLTLDAVRTWLADWRAAGDRPVFLWVHLFDPHTPYVAPEAFRALRAERRAEAGTEAPAPSADPPTIGPTRYTRRGEFLAGVTNRDYARFVYDEGVAYTDHLVGSLLGSLAEEGIDERALIVVAADHGESLGEHDVWYGHELLYPEVVRVPLILRVPGGPAGARVVGRVSTLDIATTLREYLFLDASSAGGLESFAPSGENLIERARDPRGVTDRRVWFVHANGVQVGSRDGELHQLWTREEFRLHFPSRKVLVGDHRLYRAPADPACASDVSAEETALADERARAARAWYDERASGVAVQRALSDEERARLEAMGYFGDEGAGD